MAKSNYIASLRQVARSILLPVAFLTQAVHLTWAQIDCNAISFVITTQEDADKLSSCSYFQGSVFTAREAEGDIIIDGLKAIGGVFRADGPSKLTSISSPSLNLVGSVFAVSELDQLRSIRFPKLEKVVNGFRIYDVPELVEADFGALVEIGADFQIRGAPRFETFPVDSPPYGDLLRSQEAYVRITNSGFHSLGTFFHSSRTGQVELSNLPNLHELSLRIAKADQILIEGNGNLTIYMNGTTTSSSINFLNVTGVRAIEPCSWPAVSEFIATGNPIEHLRFESYSMKKLTVQDNPQLKSLWPLNRNLLPDFTDVIITGNPLLKLSTRSTGPDPLSGMREMCRHRDEAIEYVWDWPYSDMKTINISADIDGDFFDSLLASWSGDRKGRELEDVDITSTNPAFNCTGFDRVRTEKGGINGHYTCQGQWAPYGSAASFSSRLWLTVALFAITLGALHL